LVDPDGTSTIATLVASPQPDVKHVLAVTCVGVPRLGREPEIFVFNGGFDAPEVMTDPTKKAGFLAFQYPLSQPDKVRERLGSVDFVAKN
jgi:hypothetical protein